jgi:hypothetical protein
LGVRLLTGTITTFSSTTQFTSSAFIGTKANFIGQPLTFTSGADNGKSATVTNFDPTTGTFTFTTGAPGTLRAAILQADSQPGLNTIAIG